MCLLLGTLLPGELPPFPVTAVVAAVLLERLLIKSLYKL